MASFTTSGKLIEIFDEHQLSASFKKREFVIEIPDGNYPQQVKFQLVQDKCSLIENYSIGDEIEVQFNLQGKAFTKNGVTSFFNSLGAWKLSYANGGVENRSRPTAQPASSSNEDFGDLPF